MYACTGPHPPPRAPANAPDCRSSEPATNPFDFHPQQAPRVRRAWERIPISPRAPERKGRKVWKRAVSAKGTTSGKESDAHDDAGETNSHGVKRLRVKHMPAMPARIARRNQPFVATLQDQAPGTPKRTSQRSSAHAFLHPAECGGAISMDGIGGLTSSRKGGEASKPTQCCTSEFCGSAKLAQIALAKEEA